MASDLSPYFGNKIVRWVNGNAMPTAPTALYLAIFNGNPKTSGVEVGGVINVSTARRPITFATVASGAAHLLTSNVAVDWGNAAAATDFTHLGLYDASSSGNLIASKIANGAPISVAAGASVLFASGAVTFNVGSDT
jgi:hypothetical protein